MGRVLLLPQKFVDAICFLTNLDFSCPSMSCDKQVFFPDEMMPYCSEA